MFTGICDIFITQNEAVLTCIHNQFLCDDITINIENVSSETFSFFPEVKIAVYFKRLLT